MKIVHRILLIALSVLLIILSFEPFAFRFLALVAWIPFLISLRGAIFRVAYRLGILHGMLVFGGALSWTLHIFSTFAIALWFILSLFPALFAGLSSQTTGKWRPLLIATLWTGLEFLRGELFWLHFPWITPGTALPPNFFTPLVGVYGVSFLVLLGASFIIASQRLKQLSGAFLLLSIWLAPHFHFSKSESPTIKVALIQNESMNYDDYRIATTELEEQVDAIVWPEYAIGFDPTKLQGVQAEIAELLGSEAKVFVAGGKSWLDDDGDIYANTAFTFGRERILGTHTKNRLVHFFAEGEKGTEAKSISSPLGQIGTPICFDCDHQDVIRRMTADGAELFLIPSMDAAHWSERQHLQHGQLFRHRAAENSRWLAIASTSGLTQIINPKGETVASIPLMEEGSLVGLVSTNDVTTPFQIGGWIIGPISLAGTSIITIVMIVSSIKKRLNAKA
ncbi:MAG: nitrilase-related carbon-nitrogen hydrolase [Akkermansiaceae bacterium]